MSKMKKNSIAFFNSNDIYPVSADSTLPFEQHRDIFYLSGVDQEESVLMLCPNASNPNPREVLFLKETDDHIAVWEGPKLNKQQAYETSGVKSVYWLDEIEKIIDEVAKECDTIYYNHNEHYRAKIEMETREERFNKWLENKFPKKIKERSNPILQHFRATKDPIELGLIQKACDITNKGFRRVLNFVNDGVWEYEIEAEFIHDFLKNRSKKFAYSAPTSISINSPFMHCLLFSI